MELQFKPKVVLALITWEGKFALIKRKIPAMKVEWAFPGGVTNPGETDEAAVEREAMDELRLEVEAREKLLERKHPDTFVEIAYFHCVPTGDTNLQIGEPAEISEVEWVPAGQVLARFTSDVHPKITEFVQSFAK